MTSQVHSRVRVLVSITSSGSGSYLKEVATRRRTFGFFSSSAYLSAIAHAVLALDASLEVTPRQRSSDQSNARPIPRCFGRIDDAVMQVVMLD